MNQSQQTVNPAGAPIVRPKESAGYGRQDFIRDLKKVATKSPPGKPKAS